jgi:hypothetical protein
VLICSEDIKKRPALKKGVGYNFYFLPYEAQVTHNASPPMVTVNAAATLTRIPMIISFFVSMGEV